MTATQTTVCEWSDLLTTQCDHCTPGARGTRVNLNLPQPVHQPRANNPTSPNPTDAQLIAVLNKAARALDRNQPATLHDYLQALTEPTTHHEPYSLQVQRGDGTSAWLTVRHRTLSAPLLEQLWTAVTSTGAHDGGARSFASKPAARLDAIDVAQAIDQGVTDWLKRLNLKHPGDPIQALKRAAANAGDDILKDVRLWWIRARTVTGWDAPAWKLNNTCPLCGRRGGIRIRLDAGTATCVECGEAWDTNTIGLLADHVRNENNDHGLATATSG